MQRPDTRSSGSRPAAHVPLSLRALQEQFAAAVYADDTGVLRFIRAETFPATRHLQVYRNNTFANLTDALASIYPVIQRLVGTEFFEYTADDFIRRHPPRSGNLHDFGGELAGFLATFEPAAGLAYLPDVARLEWAWHEAFHAADTAPLAVDRLAQVPPEKYDALVFQLHPSARVMASDYPVLRIWEVNQSDFNDEPAVHLDQGGEQVLVLRRGFDVTVERLTSGEYVLLQSFAIGAALGAAFETAVAAQPDFDLMLTLRRHVTHGTLTDFREE